MKIDPKLFRSQLENIKDLEKRNKAFEKLSNVKKRREIAYDCLKLTLAGKVKGANYRNDGAYWSYNLRELEIPTAKEFQEKLVNELPECKVCVRGGMMLSQIRLGNNISTNDDNRYSGMDNIKGFTYESFKKMEKEYESDNYRQPYIIKTTEKLQNICLNIIANGNFNTEDKTDYLVEYLKK